MEAIKLPPAKYLVVLGSLVKIITPPSISIKKRPSSLTFVLLTGQSPVRREL